MEIRFDQPKEPTVFAVQMHSGQIVHVEGADAYQPEGPLTTFFAVGTSRRTIDSWSVRVSSYRTADIVAINRVGSSVLAAA